MMSVQEAVEIMNGKRADMLSMMKAKRVLESLGPVQGPQETQMEIEARQLRAVLEKWTPEEREAAAFSWKGTANSLSRDYN